MVEGQIARTISVLPVNDIAAATAWYAAALDFEAVYLHEGEHQGEESNYAVLVRDGVEVHLILDEPPPHGRPWTKSGTGYLYLKVCDVDAVYQEAQAREIPLASALRTESWGARAFDLVDPSGNEVHIEEERCA